LIEADFEKLQKRATEENRSISTSMAAMLLARALEN